jgi:hypothetical protein
MRIEKEIRGTPKEIFLNSIDDKNVKLHPKYSGT